MNKVSHLEEENMKLKKEKVRVLSLCILRLQLLDISFK